MSRKELKESSECAHDGEVADLPSAMDRIQVLWELEDGVMYWWNAEVISITHVFTGNILAVGSVLYDRRPGFGKEECEVEFSCGNLVRPKRISRRQVAQPENSWRLHVSPQVLNEGDAEWSLRTDNFPTGRRAREENSQASHHGSDQPQPKKRHCRGNRKESRGIQRDESDEQHEIYDQVGEALEVCFKRLGRVERTIRSRFDNMSMEPHDYHVTVVRFLRRALLRQLQRPFRRATIGNGVVHAGHSLGFVSTHVDCTLRDFAAMAGDLCDDIFNAQFWPSLTAARSMSLATKEVCVSFPTLGKLCSWMGIHEDRDRESMLIREGSTASSGSERVLRVLGGMLIPGAMEAERGVRYYIGRSSAHLSRNQEAKLLHRSSSEWDNQNDCFVHPLQVRSESLPLARVSNCTEDVQEMNGRVFHISWRRAVGLSSRLWTDDVTCDGDALLGELHVSLPVIYFHFPSVCDEVNTVMTDELCREVVR